METNQTKFPSHTFSFFFLHFLFVPTLSLGFLPKRIYQIEIFFDAFKNVSWPWLCPLQGWGSLWCFLGNLHIYILYIYCISIICIYLYACTYFIYTLYTQIYSDTLKGKVLGGPGMKQRRVFICGRSTCGTRFETLLFHAL